MKYLYPLFLALIAILTTSATLTTTNPKEANKDGIIYYMTHINGEDTTYTIFSVYNVKQQLEWEIGDTLIKHFNQNTLKNPIIIKTSKGIVYGTCTIETYEKATLVDYTVYKYIWNDGTSETVNNKNKY